MAGLINHHDGPLFAEESYHR